MALTFKPSAVCARRLGSILAVRVWLGLLASVVLLSVASARVCADATSDAAALEQQATYGAALGSHYAQLLEMSALSDSMTSTIEDYRIGAIDEAEFRQQYDEIAGNLRKAIDAFSASVAALPDAPTFRDAGKSIELGAERVAEFRRLLLRQPASLRQEFDLIERKKAAVLADDMDAFERLDKEHYEFLARDIDLETESIRQQIALSEEHSLGIPLWRIAAEINDALAALVRWNVEAEPATLPRTLGTMRDHLGEARVALRAGLSKTEQTKSQFARLTPRTAKDREVGPLMDELFANVAASYENERRLIETMQDFVDALERSQSDESSVDENVALVEELSVAIQQFITHRVELDSERHNLAARIGAVAAK